MKNIRHAAETALIEILAQMLRTEAVTVSVVLSNPGTLSLLMQAVFEWAAGVACRQRYVTETARDIGMEPDEVVSDFTSHVFRQGEKAENPYPCLTGTLNTLLKDGPEAVIPYLMTAARNRMRDLERRSYVRADHAGEIHSYDKDGEDTVLDPGSAMDPDTGSTDEDIIRRRVMKDFLEHLGDDFISDLVILSDSMGFKRERVRDILYAGKQAELVLAVARRMSNWLRFNCMPCMTPMLEAARAYVLPARFREDPKAFLAYLYRQSSGKARGRLYARLQACGF
ncbi:MAG: hypothetical protein IKK21_02300 [Clostridia bacterium]|nr:hypothetical protein [Clostridia bacterium]